MAMKSTGSPSTENASITTKNGTLYCEPFGRIVASKGILFGEDPLEFSLPLLLLQIGLFTSICAILQLLLKPFKQPKFVPQILGGIALGPSFLGHNEIFRKKVFSTKGSLVLDVYELLGFMFFALLAGARTDMKMVKKSGRRAFIIGMASFFVPMIITISVAFFLSATVNMDKSLQRTLPMVASFESTTSFHVISGLLTDLKLLNSEVGHLAQSSALISGSFSFIFIFVSISIEDSSHISSRCAVLANQLCKLFMIITIAFVFRPIMFWMIRRTPEGKTLKQANICALTLMLLGCAFYGEVMGFHFLLGPILFGLAVPAGPPLGSSLADKLDCFVSAVLMPCYIINIGRRVNLFVVGFNTFLVVEFISIVSTFVKLLAIMVPSLLFKMPLLDALSLSLLLNCQGFFNIQYYDRARNYKLINEDCFGIMVIMAVVHSAAFTPLVSSLYDPSRRYVAYKRRTIQHSRRNAELRILACVHQEDDVPTIISILETSNPTRESPIGVYVLDLVKLVGNATPQLIRHQFDKFHSFQFDKFHSYNSISKSTRTNSIIKAFRRYELHNQGIVTVHCSTAIAPYATMHDDICSLALEKSTSLVIIPFNKSESQSIRTVNKNVLENAPCSVGILINSGTVMDSRSILAYQLNLHVCAIFLGGPDDRETLAYATRMAEHPTIRLTVLRIVAIGHINGNLIDRRLDMNAINDFRISTLDNRHVVYKEEGVTEVTGTGRVLHSLGNDYELVLVGRRHDSDSPLLEGLAEWNEIEELGIIGDLLVSSDFNSKASVLVVQQQASVVKEMLESPKFKSHQLR